MKLKQKSFSALASGIFVCAAVLGISSQASAESVLESVKANGKITVATEVAYPPMEFLKGGKVVGYGKDVLDLVVADLGVKLNQLQLPWDGILAGVLAKKYDMVATSVAIKSDRVNKYAFTRPLAIAETMLIQRHGDSMMSLDDVDGKIIGVELGSSQAQEVEAADAELKAAGKKGFDKINGFKSTDDMRLALANGQIDIGTIPSFSLAPIQKQRPNTFAKLTSIGNGTLFAWVLHPDGKELRDRVNEILASLEKNGTLSKLQIKWFGFEMDLPEDYLPAGAL
jgi:polar amino acid transport system substrate-binding protein